MAQYLVQHHEFCQQPQNTNRIDEVQEHFEGMTREDFQGQPKPSVLLARLTRERQASLGQFKSERIFSCLQFCDEILHEEADFKVEWLRSHQEIAEAARVLKNCAENFYVESAASGECFLVVLKKAEKMVAMADWRPEERRYVELVESCNQPLRKEWKEVFMRAERQMPKALSVTFEDRIVRSTLLLLVGSSYCKRLKRFEALLGLKSETNRNLTIASERIMDVISPQQLGDGGTLDSETDPCYEGILAAVPSIANLAMDDDDRELLGAVVQGGVRYSLEEAAKAGSLEIKDIQKLIEAGLGPYLSLRAAVFSGSVKMTQMLLEAGADLHAVDFLGRAPLHEAAFFARCDIVQFLLQSRADVHAKTKRGSEAFDLVFHDDDDDDDSDGGDEPFWLKDRVPQQRTALALADAGADLDSGHKLLGECVQIQSKELVQRLVESRADVNATYNSPEYGWATPLCLLAKESLFNLEMAELLVKLDADVNRVDEWDGKTTPLHSAAGLGNSKMAMFLVNSGADVNAEDIDGRTPLHSAVCLGDETSSSLFSGGTVAELARLERMQMEVLLVLVEAKADLGHRDQEGETPLHAAVMENEVEAAKFLIDARADINATNEFGETPLDHARWLSELLSSRPTQSNDSIADARRMVHLLESSGGR